MVLKELHKETGVTLKLHLLTAHLVPHLRKHRSWGRVSEQGIESLHALITKLNRRFAPVRNPQQKCMLILKQFMNQNVIFDSVEDWNSRK